ncbi:hypothetical protein CFAM422_012703 [Trichoderma lentiforme]|uniref:Uncharacterized protein n=1 Tax=Trichoderma lentiforme TaxID=1567552 RepID=A0A9P4X3N0_9HYPO|nr:hypothetical protein CFAM422_012703 [Trichoderma lentiforme]
MKRYRGWPAMYVLFIFVVFTNAQLSSILTRCPAQCNETGPNPSAWTYYHDFNALVNCNATVLFELNVYNSVDDSDTHLSFRACTADGQESDFTDDHNGEFARSCPSSSATSAHIADAALAAGQLGDYMRSNSHYTQILFAKSKTVIAGLFSGSQIQASSACSVVQKFANEGLRIIDYLPDSIFEFLSRPDGGAWRPRTSLCQGGCRSDATAARDLEFDDIIRMFSRLEMAGSFFSAGVIPVVALRAYNFRRGHDGAQIPDFATVEEFHAQFSMNFCDVVARLYEVSGRDTDKAFWASGYQMNLQRALRKKTDRLHDLAQRFLTMPYAPKPNTAEHVAVQIDMLHYDCSCTFLEQMTLFEPQIATAEARFSAPLAEELERKFEDIIHRCEYLLRATRKFYAQKTYYQDLGTTSYPYLMHLNSRNEIIRTKALQNLQIGCWRETFWDGLCLLDLEHRVRHAASIGLLDLESIPRTLCGISSMPELFTIASQISK